MKTLAIPLIAIGIGLAACNATAQADATVVAEAICSGAAQEQASGLVLNKTETTAVNAVVAGCNATAQGTNLSSATAVAAIFSGLVTLQQGGLLTQIKMKALAPEEVATLVKYGRTRLSDHDIDWLVSHAR
jgi:hypothetical protein